MVRFQNILPFITLVFSLCHAEEIESVFSKRIQGHLFLKDYQTAMQEAKAAFTKNPLSKSSFENYIITLLRVGEENKAILLFEEYQRLYGINLENTDFLEEVAFGLIQCGIESTNPTLRAISLIAAFHANDSRGVVILKKGLEDKSAIARAVSIKLVSNLRDKMLQQEILEIIRKERLYDLKLDAIRAAGSMKIQEAKPLLINLITSSREGDEARAAALNAYINLNNTLRKEDLYRMAKSERAGFRELADSMIAHLELENEIDIPLAHLNDTNQDVKRNAIIVLGKMFHSKHFPKEQVIEKLKNLILDQEDNIRIAALWLMTLLAQEIAEKPFLECLKNVKMEVRVKAAAAMAATGFLGSDLLLKAYRDCKCPYAKLNLAIGMIPLGIEEVEVLKTLKSALQRDEKWSIMEDSLGTVLIPSKIQVSKEISVSPESMNQLIRLRLLNILAIKGDSETSAMLRAFLKERRWGITGVASALLLTEGGEEARKCIESLLNDAEKKVRVQAAFVLALWKSGDRALTILQEAYEGVDRDLKIKVLEALGNIGNKKSLPFLAEKLSEPYPTLRLATSLAIIQTIYH